MPHLSPLPIMSLFAMILIFSLNPLRCPSDDCLDSDGDGYGEGRSCAGPDCNDANDQVSPAQPEICDDGIDNDCDLALDDADTDCLVTPPELELYPTINSIGVNLSLGSRRDPEGDARASMTYRRSSDGPSRTGFPPDFIASANRFSGSIFFTSPATTYQVDVTVTDATSPDINFHLSGEITTRAEPTFELAQKSYFASPDGHGSACTLELPCDFAQALAQVQAGEEIVLTGGIYYGGSYRLKQSGQAGLPITIRSADGANAIFDGSDPVAHTWREVSGYPGMYVTDLAESNANTNGVFAEGERLYPYHGLADLQSQAISCILAQPVACGLSGFFRDPRPSTSIPLAQNNPLYRQLFVKFNDQANPASKVMAISRYNYALDLSEQRYVQLRRLSFRYYAVSPSPQAIKANNASDLIFDSCDFIHNDMGILFSGNSSRNIVQYCNFRDSSDWDTYIGKATYEPISPFICYQTSPDLYPWNDRVLERGGIVYGHNFSGRGMIVRYNRFEGFMDGFKAVPPSTPAEYTTTEFDIHNNVIQGGDDGTEVDGMAANVRLWENSVNDCNAGISLAPPSIGPVYLLYNTFYEMHTSHATISGYSTLQTFAGHPFKFQCEGCLGGAVYFLHNSIYSPGEAYGMDIFRPTQFERFYARNNIIVSASNYALNITTYETGNPPIDLDYNSYDHRGDLASIALYSNPVIYPTLPDLTAAFGYEIHGLELDPHFADPASHDFRLLPDSPVIDAGVILPGINDERYQGENPDLGAWEAR